MMNTHNTHINININILHWNLIHKYYTYLLLQRLAKLERNICHKFTHSYISWIICQNICLFYKSLFIFWQMYPSSGHDCLIMAHLIILTCSYNNVVYRRFCPEMQIWNYYFQSLLLISSEIDCFYAQLCSHLSEWGEVMWKSLEILHIYVKLLNYNILKSNIPYLNFNSYNSCII